MVVEFVYVHLVADRDSAAVLRRAEAHLERLGYAREAARWRRGTAWGGLGALSMDRLGTEVIAEVAPEGDGTRLNLRYRVRTFGQFITKTNRRFWDLEAEEVTQSARGGAPDVARRALYEREAKKDLRRFLAVSAMVATGLAAGIVALAWRLTGAAS